MEQRLIDANELYGIEKLLSSTAKTSESKVLMEQVLFDIENTPTVGVVPAKLLNEALTLLKAAEYEAWMRCDCNYCAVVGCARLTGTRRKCLAGDGSWKWQYADRYEKLKVAAERTNKNESN